MRSCARTTEQRYLDRTSPDKRSPNYRRERSGIRTQEDSIRRCGNYAGVIMGRQDDSPEHKTLSGGGGRAPDAVRTRRQGTRRCQDAASGHQTLSGHTRQRGLCPGGVWIQGGNKGKSGCNIGSTWRPNSRLTFCGSGGSDAQDALDAS